MKGIRAKSEAAGAEEEDAGGAATVGRGGGGAAAEQQEAKEGSIGEGFFAGWANATHRN